MNVFKFNKTITLSNLILGIYAFSVIAFEDGNVLVKLSRILIFLTFLLVFIKRKKIYLNLYVFWLIIFTLYSYMSIEWAESSRFSINMANTILINLICMYSCFYLINFKKEKINLILVIFMIAPIFLASRAYILGGILVFIDTRGVANISANTVGMVSAIAAGFALYYKKNILNTSKKFLDIVIIINIINTVLSGSRKALIWLIIPILFQFIFSNRKFYNIFIKIIISIMALILVWILIMNVQILYDHIGCRIETMIYGMFGSNIIDDSTKTRMRLIQWGFQWYKQRKWCGYGIDNYRIVLTQWHPDYPLSYYAHNNFIEILVDLGIIGFTIYYSIYVVIIYRFMKNIKQGDSESVFFLGLIISLIITEYGLVSYFDKYFQFLVMIFYVVSVRRDVIYEKKHIE